MRTLTLYRAWRKTRKFGQRVEGGKGNPGKHGEPVDRRAGSARRIDDQYLFSVPVFFFASLLSTLRTGPYWVSV
jgi:hypothetical protein